MRERILSAKKERPAMLPTIRFLEDPEACYYEIEGPDYGDLFDLDGTPPTSGLTEPGAPAGGPPPRPPSATNGPPSGDFSITPSLPRSRPCQI